MHIIHFLIVFFFNLLWLKNGFSRYKSMYDGTHSIWFSLFCWLYSIWGIYNLIYVIV